MTVSTDCHLTQVSYSPYCCAPEREHLLLPSGAGVSAHPSAVVWTDDAEVASFVCRCYIEDGSALACSMVDCLMLLLVRVWHERFSEGLSLGLRSIGASPVCRPLSFCARKSSEQVETLLPCL